MRDLWAACTFLLLEFYGLWLLDLQRRITLLEAQAPDSCPGAPEVDTLADCAP